MKAFNRKAVALVAGLGLAAVAAPASADVFVFADIFKDKDVVVLEDVFIDKNFDVNVDLEQEADGAAEAQAVANQRNDNNTVGPAAEVAEFLLELDARLEGSVNENNGVVGVNQDVGNSVNQGNMAAFALSESDSSFTNSQAEGEQVNELNSVSQEEAFDMEDPDNTATILDSGNGNAGIVGVNQNTGNSNNQLNAVALAVGPGAAVGLSEAALGQVNSENSVVGVETHKIDQIRGSISENSGIVGVNQSTGNYNNQGASVSLSTLTSTASITVPGS